MKLTSLELSRKDSEDKISAILSSIDFCFDSQLVKKVRRQFVDSEPEYRRKNIRRSESMLSEKSCKYADKEEIEQRLFEAFEQAKEREASATNQAGERDVRTVAELAAELVVNVWHIHPFLDGNTRLTVTLLLLYLKFRGYEVSNQAFAKNHDVFRNTLVKAVHDNDKSFAVEFVLRAMNGETWFRDIQGKMNKTYIFNISKRK